jgi:membrane-bound ClpP family serine protease
LLHYLLPGANVAQLLSARAVSGALALLALVLAVVFAPDYCWVWLIAIGVGFAAVEAATHGRIAGFLLNAVIVLAVIASAILVWEFWRVLAIGARSSCPLTTRATAVLRTFGQLTMPTPAQWTRAKKNAKRKSTL